MGWVLMSERELNRIEILSQVHDCRMTVEAAAHLLDMTPRQVFTLLKRYRSDGAVMAQHRSGTGLAARCRTIRSTVPNVTMR